MKVGHSGQLRKMPGDWKHTEIYQFPNFANIPWSMINDAKEDGLKNRKEARS
jgi:hypothetical protein